MMTVGQSGSEDCSGWIAEVRQLEAENQQLRMHVQQLENYIDELEHVIEELQKRIRKLLVALQRIWQYVVRVLSETRPILSRRSGVPRGNWAYCLGADEVADEVETLVQEVANG